MTRFIAEAKTAGAKVVLVGDSQQLQAILAGGAFRTISEHVGAAQLTEIRRQHHEWQRQATTEFGQGKIEQAITRYQEKGFIQAHDTKAQTVSAMTTKWLQDRLLNPYGSQFMLAYTRDDVGNLNQEARGRLHALGLLSDEREMHTASGKRLFAVGDDILFLKNDKGLGVKNGSRASILAIDNDVMKVKLFAEKSEQGREISFSVREYAYLDYGYAVTIHKSQAATIDNSYVLASRYLDAHASYVSMTRHRDNVTLFYSKEEFSNEKQLYDTLKRDKTKETTIDYVSCGTEKFPPLVKSNILERQGSMSEKILDIDANTLKVVERFKVLLEKAETKKGSATYSLYEERLTEIAHRLASKQNTIAYVAKTDTSLAKRIEEFSLTYQQQLDKGLSY